MEDSYEAEWAALAAGGAGGDGAADRFSIGQDAGGGRGHDEGGAEEGEDFGGKCSRTFPSVHVGTTDRLYVMLQARPKKNIETDIVGDKMGRIHLGRQDLDELQTRKMKGLKRSRDVATDNEEDEAVLDLDVISDGDDGSEDEDEGNGVEAKRPRLDS